MGALHDAQVLLHHVIRQDAVGQLLRIVQLGLDPVGKERDHLHAAFVQLLVVGGVGQAEGGQDAGKHQRHGQRQNQRALRDAKQGHDIGKRRLFRLVMA